ncbi:hypothetical protein [Streptomyces sp. NPDC002746]
MNTQTFKVQAGESALKRTDAKPVAQHVRRLTAGEAGPSLDAIARAADVPASTLKTLLKEVDGGGPRTVATDTAQRLLAVGSTIPVPKAPQFRLATTASQVVGHIRDLQHAYELASAALIAKTAGLPATTLKSILNQYPADPQRTVSSETARKIFAVTDLPSPAFPRQPQVSDVGLLRRLQGLCALGWTLGHVAQAAGASVKPLNDLLVTGVGSPTARAAVLIAWSQLSHRPGPSSKASERATKKCWATPFAWDEETIDLPTAQAAGARTSGRSQEWTPEQFRSELDFLQSLGLNWTESLHRLGIKAARAHELLAHPDAPESGCPVQPLPSGPPPDQALAA